MTESGGGFCRPCEPCGLGRSTNDGVSDPASRLRTEPRRDTAGSLTPSFVCKDAGSGSVQLLREGCGTDVTSVMPPAITSVMVARGSASSRFYAPLRPRIREAFGP
jgi:hypothetical protein